MYEYLEDQAFLKKLDAENNLTKRVRISVLDFNIESTIATIEGKVTGGNISLNGSSAMRRTLSLSLLADPKGIEKQGSIECISYSNINEVNNIISINKKIKVEIGFENIFINFNEYKEYDIIWIPLGTYVIKTASVSTNNSGTNISLTLNDKTSALNGDVGGTIPAATVFSETESYGVSPTEKTTTQLLIKDIIKHLVVDFGGERPENVIIEDIPDIARKAVRWEGSSNLYLYESSGGRLEFTTEIKKDGSNNDIPPSKTFTPKELCGYVVESFHYPGKLECNVGETVSAMLDKIKNALGNYEWFYDVWGRFHFQEKKNYLNTAHASNIVELERNGYLLSANLSKSVYTFDATNKHMLSSISSSPQYQNVKNDFVVWGTGKTSTGAQKPIRYHLTFAAKPDVSQDPRLAFIYTDYLGHKQVTLLREGNYSFDTTEEDKNKFYLVRKNIMSEDGQTIENTIYEIQHWDEKNKIFRVYEECVVCYLYASDWRAELYFKGLEDVDKPFATNYYAAELNAEWPKIYNVQKTPKEEITLKGIKVPSYMGGYKDDIPAYEYDYFLDFIGEKDADGQLLFQFNIDNIGRRTKAINDSSINCIFTNPDAPMYAITLADGKLDELQVSSLGYEVIQVDEGIFNNLVTSGGENSAYDRVKELLIQHTNYNEAITLSTTPIYHLEPNTRIHIENTELGINGDYMINTISVPLGFGTSNISCTKCIEKTI